MYHTLLDAAAHLFGQTPSRGQNVAEAVFGFGPDGDVTSGEIVFPLFIRNQSEHRSRFTYLGNYVAIRLSPVAWERLSEEVRLFDFSRTEILSQGSTRERTMLSKPFGTRVIQQIPASIGWRKPWNMRPSITNSTMVPSRSPALGWSFGVSMRN